MPEQIRRIGCIPFDDAASANPHATIKSALTNCGDLSDALIVLPEALNFDNNKTPAALPFGLSNLETLSREFHVAFIAGLMEKPCWHTYNSAFLIDPECTPRCLSRKLNLDGVLPYKEYSGDVQCIPYRGLMLACLICLDASIEIASANEKTGAERERVAKQKMRQERLRKCLISSLDKHAAVLCVPARMDVRSPKAVAIGWPEQITVVIANINTQNHHPAHDSGIRMANREWKLCGERMCLEHFA